MSDDFVIFGSLKISNEINVDMSQMLTKGVGNTSKLAGSAPGYPYPDILRLKEPKSLYNATKYNIICWSDIRSKSCAMKVMYKNKIDSVVKGPISVFNDFYGERVNKRNKR